MPNSTLLHQLFFTEPAGRFTLGQVYRAADVFWEADGFEMPADAGTWRCDIEHNDRLTWSDAVYEMFGLRAGDIVPREAAVARYLEHSRNVLSRLRGFAIEHGCGFILDAAIDPHGTGASWIRILAVPVVEDGRVVGLHGLKRALQSTTSRRSRKAVKRMVRAEYTSTS
jgi:hypothetical protein